MRVELTRDVSYLLTKGNEYEAHEEGDMVAISFSSDVLVPKEFVRPIEYAVLGVALVEGQTYDVQVRNWGSGGRATWLRGWTLASVGKDSWSEGLRLRFRKRGSRWGGVTRSVDSPRVVSIAATENNRGEPPGDEPDTTATP